MMKEIDELRKMINQADSDILKLVEDRFEIVKDIGKYKKAKKIPIEDLRREKEIISSRIKSSELDSRFIEKFFKLLFEESKRIQREL